LGSKVANNSTANGLFYAVSKASLAVVLVLVLVLMLVLVLL
jgi:hypothetical protein